MCRCARRFEHPQNVVLGQVIATNLELEALAGEPTQAGLAGGPVAAEQRLARTLRLWLELQACVSGFIDSTAADKDVMVQREQLALLSLVDQKLGCNGVGEPKVQPGHSVSAIACATRRGLRWCRASGSSWRRKRAYSGRI